MVPETVASWVCDHATAEESAANAAASASTQGRHDARLAECFGVTIAFEIHEEEQTILQDGAAQRCSEDVAVQLRGTIGLATLKLSRLDEIVVGADERVAVVFVH